MYIGYWTLNKYYYYYYYVCVWVVQSGNSGDGCDYHLQIEIVLFLQIPSISLYHIMQLNEQSNTHFEFLQSSY